MLRGAQMLCDPPARYKMEAAKGVDKEKETARCCSAAAGLAAISPCLSAPPALVDSSSSCLVGVSPPARLLETMAEAATVPAAGAAGSPPGSTSDRSRFTTEKVCVEQEHPCQAIASNSVIGKAPISFFSGSVPSVVRVEATFAGVGPQWSPGCPLTRLCCPGISCRISTLQSTWRIVESFCSCRETCPPPFHIAPGQLDSIGCCWPVADTQPRGSSIHRRRLERAERAQIRFRALGVPSARRSPDKTGGDFF